MHPLSRGFATGYTVAAVERTALDARREPRVMPGATGRADGCRFARHNRAATPVIPPRLRETASLDP